MQIACLGWGSLVWDPGSLPIQGNWQCDGPFLPLEFARQPSDDRITIVIADVPDQVQSLWALLTSRSVDAARQALARRESISGNIESAIGYWINNGKSGHDKVAAIGQWGADKALDAVVWVVLKPGFRETRGIMPTETEVVDFLRSLRGDRSEVAKRYICNAPAQINTRYRRRIEKELGWLPSSIAFSACGLTAPTS
jgi:hypothetical protein